MRKVNYKKFDNKKLQKMVINEIKNRIRLTDSPVDSIAAFIAQNFEPNENNKRTFPEKVNVNLMDHRNFN